MPKQLKLFCVGHTLPLFSPSAPFEMLCPASLGIPNERVIADDRFGSEIEGGSLAEYSQLFGLHDLLRSGEVIADELFLFQYRKFISPAYGGVDSTSQWLRILTPETTPGIFPSMEQLESLGSRLAVGSIFNFGESIAANYARVHVVDDFTLFIAACAESGAMSPSDIKSFATLTGIIPSPALCYIHVDLFIKIIDTLKTVWHQYCRHYQIVRDGYQRRVSGYLLERLHSFLLCKWLMDGSEPDIFQWQRYAVLPSLG